MKKLSLPTFLVLGIGTWIALSSCLYVIDETEQVIITEFGKAVGKPINSDPKVNEAGLHFKKPFVQTVNRIEKRVMEWDGPATEMPTRDKLYITVDNFARWRIADPKRYFESLRDTRTALSRLDDAIGGATRSVIAKHDLIEVIRSDKNRKAALPDDLIETGIPSNLPTIRFGRQSLDQEILKAAKSKATLWGIELIDVRFKRINYKAGVIDKIYDRMRTERQQIAAKYISEGEGEAAKIKGRMEKELLEIQSMAYRQEQEIKGKADAEATQIYAAAYNSSDKAPAFYQFLKTLDTYSKTIDRETTAVMTTDSDLFRLLKKIE
ncbi:MAG: protease modulator HflC [Verrucomicrobiota bacterium]|jgi:membrane protease subunit HflC|nr:MAG: protease modulator HflC [Verrucomicrobiota bacterium]